MPHLNYCRQAMVGITDYLHGESMPLYARKGLPIETTRFLHELALSDLKAAVKFSLPKFGATIEDNELRGIQSVGKINLPFKIFALEYVGSQAVVDASPNQEVKTVVLVKDSGCDDVLIQRFWFGKSLVTGLHMWNFVPECSFSKSVVYGQGCRPHIRFTEPTYPIVSEFEEIPLLYEFWPTVGFLNALACKNVHIEKSPAKATKQGKKVKAALPFDDYHFLTVDVPGKAGARGEGFGGSHRSPREHLRRGHIRRLESGPVWVNACAVNAGIGSEVRKSYLLRNRNQSLR